MRYVLDRRHPLQPLAGIGALFCGFFVFVPKYQVVVEAVAMWESQRDFQGVWEGWEAGFMAFHAFHTLSFPWPALGQNRDDLLALCHLITGSTLAFFVAQQAVPHDESEAMRFAPPSIASRGASR